MSNTNEQFQMIAKTFFGLETVLAKELKELGAKSIQTGIRAVEFYGNTELLYKANFNLRTALKILKPIAEVKINNENEFYNAVKSVDWSKYIDLKTTFSVDAVVNSKLFTHSKYISLKAKDAIVDQFREKFEKRPYVDTENPDIFINIHIAHDTCTISLDSSGESLHKRGYRIQATKAPLNEVLAAGMVLLSGWNKSCDLIDPMCGSGTILIEAALIAYNIPPGIYRKSFAFENWPDFNHELWQKVTDEETNSSFNHKIIGSDISDIAIRIATENIKNASLQRKIQLNVSSIEDYVPETKKTGMVITNPPYGERLKENDLEGFYKKLGDRFKTAYPDFNIWILSSNIKALKSFGLHPSEKLTLFNGPIECKFLKYSIYKGSKKQR